MSTLRMWQVVGRACHLVPVFEMQPSDVSDGRYLIPGHAEGCGSQGGRHHFRTHPIQREHARPGSGRSLYQNNHGTRHSAGVHSLRQWKPRRGDVAYQTRTDHRPECEFLCLSSNHKNRESCYPKNEQGYPAEFHFEPSAPDESPPVCGRAPTNSSSGLEICAVLVRFRCKASSVASVSTGFEK